MNIPELQNPDTNLPKKIAHLLFVEFIKLFYMCIFFYKDLKTFSRKDKKIVKNRLRYIKVTNVKITRIESFRIFFYVNTFFDLQKILKERSNQSNSLLLQKLK